MYSKNQKLVLFVIVISVTISCLLLFELSNIQVVDEKNESKLAFVSVLSAIILVLQFLGFFAVFRMKESVETGKIIGFVDENETEERNDTTDSQMKNTVGGDEFSTVAKNLDNLFENPDSLEMLCNRFLSIVCSHYKLAQGIISIKKKDTDEFFIRGTYAYYNENTSYTFKLGEGISGQVAKNKKSIVLSNIPEGYVNIVSGLGGSSPKYLNVIPVVFDNSTIGIIELASFVELEMEINDNSNSVIKHFAKCLNEFL